ncbi:MAG: ribonuclease III [Gemmataceae bacterium]|nr:ribonuclease III [Gemmataceae bacterium]
MPTEWNAADVAEILEDCQRAINYRFRQPELLRAALTHTSGANTRAASNERLEFLGDAVLGLICCEQLYHRYPNYHEGDMTKIKSLVVSRRICALISQQLGLDKYLFLGKGMGQSKELPANVLADVFESLVAAIYLDGGLDAARRFLMRWLIPIIERVSGEAHAGNYKSQLQQVAQREFGETPRYLVLDEQGPDHNKCFKVAAHINQRRFVAAWGRNKKEAEMKAAMNALAQIHGKPIPFPAD